MPYGDPTPNLPVTTNHSHTVNGIYPQPSYNNYSPQYSYGYTCRGCGTWVQGGCHTCPQYYPIQYYPVQTVTVVAPAPDPTQREVLEELKLMRKALEILVDRTGNDHEEVRGSDEGRGGDSSADPEGGLGDTTLRDVAEIAKRLGL